MTRQEKKQLKLQKEKEFIESIKNKKITGMEKAKFRETETWRNFRLELKKKNGNKDVLTLRPLKKKWHCHHQDLNSENYTELDFKKFKTLNPQSHDVIHTIFDEVRKDKNYWKRLKKVIDDMMRYL